MSKALQSVLNVCPSCDDRAEDHKAESEERHAGNRAAEPQNFTIGDQNDGQVLEDSIDGDGEKLEGLGAGVYHDNESQGYGKP